MERAPVAAVAGRAPPPPPSPSMALAAAAAGPTEPLGPIDLLVVGLLIGLILVSVVGNCLVCVAIFTDRRLRKLGNAFIVSLAIADLFVSCLVMTFALCNDLMNHWIFGDWFCDVWISFDIMCCTASILNLCAISLDRFIHIKDCLLYNQWMTRRVAISAVIIIWFISGLVSFVPINLGWHKPDHFGGGGGVHHLARPNPLERPASEDAIVAAAAATTQELNAKLNYLPLGPAGNQTAPRPIENQSSSASLAAAAAATSTPLDTLADVGQQRTARWRSANSRRREADFVSSLAGSSSGQQPRASWPNDRESAQSNQVESNSQNGSQIGLDLQRVEAQSSPLLPPLPSPSPPAEPPGRTGAAGSDGAGSQLPLCMLTLTPTYAIISSTISFYIPCIIMLGLYTKLFACARRHVRNIQAISKAPAPIAVCRPPTTTALDAADAPIAQHCALNQPPRTWLKFGRRQKSNAQSHDKSGPGLEPQNGRPVRAPAVAAASSTNATLAGGFAGPELSDNKQRGSTGGAQRVRYPGARDDQPVEQIEPLVQESPGGRAPPSAAVAAISRPPAGCPPPQAADATRGASFTASSSSWPARAHQAPANEEQRPFLGEASEPPANKASGLSRNQATSTSQRSTTTTAAVAKTNQHVQYQHQQQQSGQLATHKAAVTLGIIMGTFLFCWVPFFCLNIIKAFCVDCIPGSVFRAFTWLGYANSALNPIIYGIHNSEFRCAFNRIFFKHLNIKNSRYYLNRRFSYDLRHSNANRSRIRKSFSQADSKQSYKSDTVT